MGRVRSTEPAAIHSEAGGDETDDDETGNGETTVGASSDQGSIHRRLAAEPRQVEVRVGWSAQEFHAHI